MNRPRVDVPAPRIAHKKVQIRPWMKATPGPTLAELSERLADEGIQIEVPASWSRWGPEHVVFLDETATTTRMARERGRSPRRQTPCIHSQVGPCIALLGICSAITHVAAISAQSGSGLGKITSSSSCRIGRSRIRPPRHADIATKLEHGAQATTPMDVFILSIKGITLAMPLSPRPPQCR